MAEEPGIRDRVVRLEAEVEHIADKVDDMHDKVTRMHDLLQQARGARWAIIGLATMGGFLAGKVGTIAAWLRI